MGVQDEAEYRRVVNAWAMYDWANSAFFTTVVAAVFPPFYRSLVMESGHDNPTATAYWAYTTAVTLLIVAAAGPVFGAVADQTGQRKRWLASFAGLGVVATALMVLLGGDAYLWASLLFILGGIGVSTGNIFYDSLLPHVAREGDIDRVSTRGYALGYLGGGILLVVNVLMIMKPEWFLLADSEAGIRLSFFSVALWWGLFSIPILRRVPEPPSLPSARSSGSLIRTALIRLGRTLARVREYRQLALFLVAFLIYNDGIGTIIKMATAYGDEIGIGMTDMILALIITQFVGIPCSFGFGRLAVGIGAKRSILLGLAIYTMISVGAFFMETAAEFYVLAFMVGLVQGGTQALSRSLYGAMVPRGRAAEFFGFFSTTEKAAGILGPLLFGVITQLAGGSRLSILSLILFFLVGGVLLMLVDVEEGKRVARGEEADSRDSSPQ
jgi:MFS transporter, UMF1 family